jgi:hypothetical protein
MFGYSHKNSIPVLAVMMLIVAMFANPALAATIGSVATSAASDLLNVGSLVLYGAYLGGLIFVVVGLFKLIQLSQQPGQPKAPALWMILVGVLLLGIGFFINTVSNTFGDSGASQGLGKLGIGG